MTVRPCSLKACWTWVVRQQIATEYNTIQYITYYSKTFICSHRSQTQGCFLMIERIARQPAPQRRQRHLRSSNGLRHPLG